MLRGYPVRDPALQMNPTQLFIAQKTQQAIRAVEGARLRAPLERTLRDLALLVGRVQVNQLVKPLPSVRAAMFRLHAQTQRLAAQLLTEEVSRYKAEPSQQNSNALYEAMRACSGVFPREAAALRRALPSAGHLPRS
jgi:hypothetical protein